MHSRIEILEDRIALSAVAGATIGDPRDYPGIKFWLPTAEGSAMFQEDNNFAPNLRPTNSGDPVGTIADLAGGFSVEVEEGLGATTRPTLALNTAGQNSSLAFAGSQSLEVFDSANVFSDPYTTDQLQFTLGVKVSTTADGIDECIASSDDQGVSNSRLSDPPNLLTDDGVGWALVREADNHVTFFATNGTSTICLLTTTNTLVPDGQTHSLYVYADGANLYIVLDGIQTGPATFANTVAPGTLAANDLWIGQTHVSDQGFYGDLADFFYSNQNLSGTPVITHWLNYNPVFTTAEAAQSVNVIDPRSVSGLDTGLDFTRPTVTLTDGTSGGMYTSAAAITGSFSQAPPNAQPIGATVTNGDAIAYVDSSVGREAMRPLSNVLVPEGPFQANTTPTWESAAQNPSAGLPSGRGAAYFDGNDTDVGPPQTNTNAGENALATQSFPRGEITWFIVAKALPKGTSTGHEIASIDGQPALTFTDPDNSSEPNSVIVHTNDGGTYGTTNPDFVNVGGWNIFEGVQSGSYGQLWVNGNTEASAISTDAGMFLQPGNVNPIYFGRPGDSGWDPKMYLAYVFCYVGALDAATRAGIRAWLASDVGVPNVAGAVVGTHLFYNGSTRYDLPGGSNGQTPLPFSDDNAIASDKMAYLPGSGATTFANVSSYTLGINGLMVDLASAHGALTANDFIFKTGNNNSPGTWTDVNATATVTTRLGAGAAGADRIEITFPNNVIQETWLEVIVKGGDALGGGDTNTGLASSNVFFWGNAVGDDGNTTDDVTTFKTDVNDELDARNNQKTLFANIPVTNIYDYDRGGKVDVSDQLAARNNPTTNLNAPKMINISVAGPFAPDAGPEAAPLAAPSASPAASPTAARTPRATSVGPDDAGLAFGLSPLFSVPSSLPPWLTGRLQSIFDSPPPVGILRALEQQNHPASRRILLVIDQIAEKYNLHDDVLDGILVDLLLN